MVTGLDEVPSSSQMQFLDNAHSIFLGSLFRLQSYPHATSHASNPTIDQSENPFWHAVVKFPSLLLPEDFLCLWVLVLCTGV